MKKILIVLVSILMSTVTMAQQDAKAGKILDEMSKKYQAMKSFKASFSVSFYSPINKNEAKSTGEILVKGTKFILKLGEREIYNNGAYQWSYSKDDNEVTKTKYTPEDDENNPTKIYTIYKKGYKYILNTEKGVNENPALYDVVDLIPDNKDKSIFKIRLFIGKKDKSLKSWKLFEKNGNRYSYALTSFQQNAVVGDDKQFEFSKKGVTVVDLD